MLLVQGQYPATTSTASMAAVLLKFYLFILLLHTTISKSGTDKRFSDFKRCADEDCSMLLCRGKAAQDYNGPDCRFLNFKKGETIYVYYKLSGKRTDVWAGSVGSRFGYFPKDLLIINHVYADQELEAATEETDFVCFDSGQDKFDSYDLDSLLSFSVPSAESDDPPEKTLDNEEKQENAAIAEDSVPDSDNDAVEDFGREVEAEEIGEDRDTESTDSSQLHTQELPPNKDEKGLESDMPEDVSAKDGLIGDQHGDASVLDSSELESIAEAPAESPSTPPPKEEDGKNTDLVSEGRTFPTKKTNFGSTFDVIVADDEHTLRVTPYYDEEEEREVKESKDLSSEPEPADRPGLISYSEEKSVPELEADSEPASPYEEDSPPSLLPDGQEEEIDAKEHKGMWSSLGDRVFSIVSGGERTPHDHVTSSEEDDEEDDGEMEMEPKTADASHKKLNASELSTSDPEMEMADVASSLNELIADELVDSKIESSVPDVPNAGLSKSPSEQKVEKEMMNEALSAVEGQPESSTLSTEEESTSLDGGRPDPLTIPRVSPEKPQAGQESQGPQQESVMLQTSTLLDEPSEEHLTKQSPEVPIKDISSQTEKSPSQNLSPFQSGVESTTTSEFRLDAEMEKRVSDAKKEIKNLLEDTLKLERPEPHHEKEQEEEERMEDLSESGEEEELLEDENAILSSANADTLDTKEEVANGEVEGEELSSEEVEADDKLEKLEDLEVADDTLATEETATDPSTEEDQKLTEKSWEPGTETDSELADLDESTSPLQESQDRKPGSGDMEYSDDVKRLTLLRTHFSDKEMEHCRKYLGLKQLLRVEAMFSTLDQELRAARQSQADSSQDVEMALETIFEASENSILDEIEKMLDARDLEHKDPHQQLDATMFDEETAILDSFQELAFRLRQKYSTASDSEPLASEYQAHEDTEGHAEVQEEPLDDYITKDLASEDLASENITARIAKDVGEDEGEHVDDPLESTLDSALRSPNVAFKDDGGRFNKNNENQETYEDGKEKGPQAILENSLDVGFGFEVESPSSGALDSASVSEYREDETVTSPPSSIFSEIGGLLLLVKECFGVYTEMVIAALPEDWQPGPTFRGLPWRAVASTAAVGILTVIAFLWRTVLAVRSKTYQLTEKQLSQRITQLCNDKTDALAKISELNEKIVTCEKQLKDSEQSADSTERENAELKESFKRLQKKSQQSTEQLESLKAEMEEERRRNQEKSLVVSKTEKEIEKLKNIVKGNKNELSKVQVLMDEARIREEALKAQVTSFQKENSALKEKKKNLLGEARDWEGKHKDLSEKIKVLQKSQKELEDALERKDNEMEVLSDCITELRQLEACDATELQKGGAPVLTNGEAADKKSDAMKIRIKQMLDVSRVKTTLSIVEEERNRYLEKTLSEEKKRRDLEEQIEKLEHERACLDSEKSQLEGQYHTIQQKLEIMNELYQQKENALQQKLTQEEFERRQKETKLSEVDGKALRAEEEVRAYKLRIQEIEEELQKTERSYKTQIASHEKKAHENWLSARSAERALVEEKRETANLRQKLVEVSDKLAEFQRPLLKPTPGRPDQQIPPMRRGDSFGPSPVSGGAPSPPLMVDGPGRPPSAPVGRRAEPFGRPPSEPHGRYPDLGHPLPPRPDVCVPRTSSPSSLEASSAPPKESSPDPAPSAPLQAPDARLSKSGSSSFLGSPIRDGSVPGPPKGMGPLHPIGGPHGPPINGHLPMMPPDPRLPPPRQGMGPYGPPRPYGPPPFIRGPPPPMRDYPMGPPPPMGHPPFGPQDFPPDMREPLHGPRDRDYPIPPRPLPPGARDHSGPPFSGPPMPMHMAPGPRNIPEGPHHPLGPDHRRDSLPPPQSGGPHRDTPTAPFSGP